MEDLREAELSVAEQEELLLKSLVFHKLLI